MNNSEKRAEALARAAELVENANKNDLNFEALPNSCATMTRRKL